MEDEGWLQAQRTVVMQLWEQGTGLRLEGGGRMSFR